MPNAMTMLWPVVLILLKATLLLGVALLAHRSLQRRLSAAQRHLVWATTLVSLLLLPVTAAIVPSWTLLPSASRTAPPVWRTAASELSGTLSSNGSATDSRSSAGRDNGARLDRARATAVPRANGIALTLPQLLLALYGAGVMVMLVRLARGYWSVRRLERSSVTETGAAWTLLLHELHTTLRVTRQVRLLRSEDPVSAVTWGIFRPTVLMPIRADGWTPERQRAVLLHELAHVVRWDCFTQLLAAMASVMYWFHPGVWWAARQLRVERELACDDVVLRAGMAPRAYAAELLDIARSARAGRMGGLALPFHEPSTLEQRMKAILDGARPRAAMRRRAVVASLAAMGALLSVVAAAQPGGRRAAPQLTEDLRIGGAAAEVRFTEVDRIVVGRDGTMFVSDSGGRRLRMYDRTGRSVRQVGSRGDGPGQFRAVIGMVVTPAGELAVYDVFTKRITLYDAEGTYVRSMPSRVAGNWTGNDFHVDRDGNLYVFGIRYTTEGRTPTAAERARSQRFYLKLSPAGAILDTVDIPRSTAARAPGGFTIMTPEAYLRPFTNELVYDLAPTGQMVWGYTKAYEFEIGRRGDRSIHVSRPFTPLPLGAEERAEWQGRADFYTKRGGPRSASSGTIIPAQKPAYRDIEVEDDGRIWVHRYSQATKRPLSRPPSDTLPPPLTWREVPTFDVFETDGRFFGTVILPENTRALARRGNQLWGVQVNANREAFVVRYRLE